MSTDALHLDLAPSIVVRRPLVPRLVRAELLKLRRRRGLMALTALLTFVPVLIIYGVAIGLHAFNPDHHQAAGGVENLASTIELISMLAGVAALLVGVTAGASDLNAGVFRELVITGRSRRALFLARIPAGLAVILGFVTIAYGIAAVSAVAFAGSFPTPDAGQLAGGAAWLLLSVTLAFTVALGVSSLVGSRSASIAGLLAWNTAVVPLLLGAGFLGVFRDGLLLGALYRLSPEFVGIRGDIDVSAPAAIATVVGWTIVPLALGCWRTMRRDV
jgi:ABC-type transport system involved in multi-copper enzyme maturation permease subunit